MFKISRKFLFHTILSNHFEFKLNHAKKFLEELKIGDSVIIFNLNYSDSKLVNPHVSIELID